VAKKEWCEPADRVPPSFSGGARRGEEIRENGATTKEKPLCFQ